MGLQSQGIAYKGLVFLAFIMVAVTLLYTNNLANELKLEEKKKVALWAKATKELSNMNDSNYDIGFVFEVVEFPQRIIVGLRSHLTLLHQFLDVID